MTPAPFTGEVLRELHYHARIGTPAFAVAARLHWPMPMLERVCRLRQIPMLVPEEPPKPAAPPRPTRTLPRSSDPRPKLKVNGRPEIDAIVLRRITPLGLSRAAGLAHILTVVMSDRNELAAALADAHTHPAAVRGLKRGRYEVRMSANLKAKLVSTAQAEHESISWVVFAIIDRVIAHDLWDWVLCGEGE